MIDIAYVQEPAEGNTWYRGRTRVVPAGLVMERMTVLNSRCRGDERPGAIPRRGGAHGNVA